MPSDAAPHLSLSFLKDFEKVFIDSDHRFWNIIDGSRTFDGESLADCAYTSMEAIAHALSKNRKLIETVITHPSVTASVTEADVQEQSMRWQKAVHNVAYLIAAMGAFRSTKQIIRVEPALEKELLNRDICSDLPTANLAKLETWGAFIEFGKTINEVHALSNVVGAFISMFQEEEQVLMQINALERAQTGCQISFQVRIALTEENHIHRFISTENNGDIKSSPIAALIQYVANVIIHLHDHNLQRSHHPADNRPVLNHSAYGAHFQEPEIETIHQINLPSGVHNAVRAIGFVDQQSSGHNTPHP